MSDIFKALLASRLLSGDWTDLTAVLQNEQGKNSTKLLHARQKLAMLYVQWDDEAFLAKSVRPFEIVGRRARLNELANAIQKKSRLISASGTKYTVITVASVSSFRILYGMTLLQRRKNALHLSANPSKNSAMAPSSGEISPGRFESNPRGFC